MELEHLKLSHEVWWFDFKLHPYLTPLELAIFASWLQQFPSSSSGKKCIYSLFFSPFKYFFYHNFRDKILPRSERQRCYTVQINGHCSTGETTCSTGETSTGTFYWRDSHTGTFYWRDEDVLWERQTNSTKETNMFYWIDKHVLLERDKHVLLVGQTCSTENTNVFIHWYRQSHSDNPLLPSSPCQSILTIQHEVH